MSLAVAATFSIEPLSRWLQFWLDELGLAPTLRFAQYNSLIAELISPIAFKGASACAGLINFADWQRALEGAPFDPQRFEADLQLLVDGIESALDLSCPLLVLFLCPSRPIACPSAAARNSAFNAGLFFSLQPHFSHMSHTPFSHMSEFDSISPQRPSVSSRSHARAQGSVYSHRPRSLHGTLFTSLTTRSLTNWAICPTRKRCGVRSPPPLRGPLPSQVKHVK